MQAAMRPLACALPVTVTSDWQLVLEPASTSNLPVCYMQHVEAAIHHAVRVIRQQAGRAIKHMRMPPHIAARANSIESSIDAHAGRRRAQLRTRQLQLLMIASHPASALDMMTSPLAHMWCSEFNSTRLVSAQLFLTPPLAIANGSAADRYLRPGMMQLAVPSEPQPHRNRADSGMVPAPAADASPCAEMQYLLPTQHANGTCGATPNPISSARGPCRLALAGIQTHPQGPPPATTASTLAARAGPGPSPSRSPTSPHQPAAGPHPHSDSASISRRWLHTGASVLAHIMPLAAAAGTPMPGMVLSPQAYRPGTGVLGPGKVPERAEMPGP